MKDGSFFTETMHRIELDHTSSGHPRLTCHTCDDDTLVRQPYMTNEQWQSAGWAFESVHGKFSKMETFVPNDDPRSAAYV